MLTGQKPFQGNSWASVMHQIMSVDPPPVKQHRQDLGDEVTTVLRKALSKDPDARYTTCREFADDLAHAVTGVTVQRTAPMAISEAMKKPLPPPRTEPLAETVVMATGSAATPDTGQKFAPPVSTVAVPPPAKQQRSVLVPILTGVAVVVIAAVAAWRLTSRPNPAPSPAAPVVAATPCCNSSLPNCRTEPRARARDRQQSAGTGSGSAQGSSQQNTTATRSRPDSAHSCAGPHTCTNGGRLRTGARASSGSRGRGSSAGTGTGSQTGGSGKCSGPRAHTRRSPSRPAPTASRN